MAEDSGAFKTNPRNSAQFRHFVIARPARGNGASLVHEGVSGASGPPICNKRYEVVALFLNQTDSRALAVSALSRWRSVL
jgi:hypothetical protein